MHPGHWRVRDESQEDKHVLLRFDPTGPDHKGDPKRGSKSSFSPEEPKSKILKGYCGGQLSPAIKLHWRRPGPISSPICTNGVRKGQSQYPVWGQTNIREQPTKEGIKLPSEESGACLWGIVPCPRTMVTLKLLSEVSGELINHSEQRLGQTLQQSEGENIK